MDHDFSDKEIINYLSRAGTIDLSDVRRAMKKEAISQYVADNHRYIICQGSDGRWRSSVYSQGKRRLIAKKSLEDLEVELYCFYTGKSKEEVLFEYTLETFYPKWLEYKRNHTKAETYIIRLESVWNNHYKDTDIVKMYLENITKNDLDEWAHRLIFDGNLTKKQYYNITVIMRQMLDYAADLNIIVANPFSSVKIDGKRLFKKERKKNSNTQVYTDDEYIAMENLAWEDYRNGRYIVNLFTPLALVFQFQTGLRIGEICALKHSDIDLESKTMLVRRMYREKLGDIVDDTKGVFGEREVFLTDRAVDVIREIESKKSKNGMPREFVFSGCEKPISYDSLKNIYPKYCRRLGIMVRSSHKARKTYISTLIDAGVNLNTIREMVGHMDEKTTLSCYCFDRNTEEEKHALIEKALNREDSKV